MELAPLLPGSWGSLSGPAAPFTGQQRLDINSQGTSALLLNLHPSRQEAPPPATPSPLLPPPLPSHCNGSQLICPRRRLGHALLELLMLADTCFGVALCYWTKQALPDPAAAAFSKASRIARLKACLPQSSPSPSNSVPFWRPACSQTEGRERVAEVFCFSHGPRRLLDSSRTRTPGATS